MDALVFDWGLTVIDMRMTWQGDCSAANWASPPSESIPSESLILAPGPVYGQLSLVGRLLL